ADIWCLGIILHRLCSFKFPHDETLDKKVFDQYSPLVKTLLSDLLAKEPEKRPTIDMVLGTIQKGSKIDLNNYIKKADQTSEKEKTLNELRKLISKLL